MFRVTHAIDLCFGHRLLNYDGPWRRLYGYNNRELISIEGPNLNDRGMVLDKSDPVVLILREMHEPLYLIDENPTAKNMAKSNYEENHSAGVPNVDVRLWEMQRCFATYPPD